MKRDRIFDYVLIDIEVIFVTKRVDKQKSVLGTLFPYLIILPTVVLSVYFILVPIFRLFQYSVLHYVVIHPDRDAFVGLDNFKKLLFEDDLFWKSLVLSGKWVVFEVGLQLICGMILALLLNANFRGKGIARTACFMPWAISGVLTTVLWKFIYNLYIGPLNDILGKIGIIGEPIAWLSNASTVFYSVASAQLWWGTPFFAITLLAALQSIPEDLYEAGYIDGCGNVKKYFYITLPFLKDMIIVTILMRSIWEFNRIDVIYTMTGGGPYYLTQTLPIYMMKTSIIGTDYGYGSAMAVVIFAILMVFVLLYMKLTNYGGDDL